MEKEIQILEIKIAIIIEKMKYKISMTLDYKENLFLPQELFIFSNCF